MLIGVWNYHESLHKDNYMLSEFTEDCLGEDSMRPFYEFFLDAKSKGHNVEILNDKRDIDEYDIFIFINFPKRNKKIVNQALNTNKPKYLINQECPIIYPETWLNKNYTLFEKVFTWADDIIDNKIFFKINCPSYGPDKVRDFPKIEKSKFCVTIISNKYNNHLNDLYWKRLEILKWFEKNHLNDLDFYGYGWNNYVFKGPRIIRVLNKLTFLTKILAPKYKNYKGEYIGKKNDLLKHYKFSICIENAKFYPGYITEKIFHCFFSLTVPIYLGSDNVQEHIPKECFIDLRDFKNYEELYKYLKLMKQDRYEEYQMKIKKFLKSEKFNQFSIKYYIETLTKNIF